MRRTPSSGRPLPPRPSSSPPRFPRSLQHLRKRGLRQARHPRRAPPYRVPSRHARPLPPCHLSRHPALPPPPASARMRSRRPRPRTRALRLRSRPRPAPLRQHRCPPLPRRQAPPNRHRPPRQRIRRPAGLSGTGPHRSSFSPSWRVYWPCIAGEPRTRMRNRSRPCQPRRKEHSSQYRHRPLRLRHHRHPPAPRRHLPPRLQHRRPNWRSRRSVCACRWFTPPCSTA